MGAKAAKVASWTAQVAEESVDIRYIAGAFMAVLTWWLDQGATMPPQEVDELFRRLVMRGVAAELGVRPEATSMKAHRKPR